METMEELKARIEKLDPETHRALRERLVARYRRQTGDFPENNCSQEDAKETARIPYLDQHGSLVIPFSCDRRHHWWNGGHSIEQTLKEIEEKLKQPDGSQNG